MTRNKQKKDKKRLITTLVLAAIILFAIMLSLNNNSADANQTSRNVKNNEDRISYLESYGWKVSEEPIEEITVTIPKDFDDVFSEYNEIQRTQGFDLSEYAGLEAVRYTYAVTNYPTGDTSVVADIIVYRNQVIAGDIQSTALDGFMHGLEMPENAEE